MRLGPWVSKLGRHATVPRSAGSGSEVEIGEEESYANVRQEKEIKTNRNFSEPIKNNQVRKRT
jgi:hypothetical protein